MGYVVLARKYRPGGLGELVGQEHIRRALSNALAMKRIPHALLFCGARGTGKTSTARIVAKMLNCEKGPTDTPCGQCSACREVSASNSVDVQELDAASNRGIDEIRELRSGVGYAPQRDRYKIYIVDEAHMLTDAAANAFLKTLEEPPPHVVFILATTDPQKLPITIRSRCQRYDFRRVKAQDVVGRLGSICEAEGIGYDQDALFLVAREGDGSMRDSLSLLDQVIAFGGDRLDTETVAALLGVADRGRTHQLLRALCQRDTAAALQALGAAHDYGLDLKTLGRTLAMEARDVLVVRLAGSAAKQLVDRSDSEIDALRQLAEGTGDGDLERLSHVLLELAEATASARYPRLVLELGVVRLCRAAQLADVAELTARVEALLASGPRLGPSRPSGSGTPGSALPPPSAGRPPAGASGPGSHAAPPPQPAPVAPRPAMPPPSAEQAKAMLRPSAPLPPLAAQAPVIGDDDLGRLQVAVRELSGNAAHASLLDSVVVTRCAAGELELGVANEFLLQQASRPELLDLFGRSAAHLFGGAWQVRAVHDPRARSDCRSAKNARAKELQLASAEATLRQHAAVRAVASVFDGTVLAVYPEGSDPAAAGT